MTLTVIDILVIALIVWSPSIVKLKLSERKRVNEVITNGEWSKNTGSRPALFNVDVVYQSGRLLEYVPAKSLDWDLSIKNPIVKYRKIEKRKEYA